MSRAAIVYEKINIIVISLWDCAFPWALQKKKKKQEEKELRISKLPSQLFRSQLRPPAAVYIKFQIKNAVRVYFFRVWLRTRSISNEKWWLMGDATPSSTHCWPALTLLFLWRLHVNQCREQNVINDKFAHWKIEPDKCGS